MKVNSGGPQQGLFADPLAGQLTPADIEGRGQPQRLRTGGVERGRIDAVGDAGQVYPAVEQRMTEPAGAGIVGRLLQFPAVVLADRVQDRIG